MFALDSNKGWQTIVDWINEQGYKVMVISKQPTNLKNIIDNTGDFQIEQRINELKWCEFYIGVGSGLSWLAWAVGKKVVMISGFSKPFCEFKSDNINIHNFNVCNGCFNTHQFDPGDWNWCPIHKNTDKQFECSINITPKMIADEIVKYKLIEKTKKFDFNKYDINYNLTESDIFLNYNKNENKFTIKYKGDVIQTLNIDIKNLNSDKIYYTLPDITLNKKNSIWCIPEENIFKDTNKLLIVFYEKNKILEIQYEI